MIQPQNPALCSDIISRITTFQKCRHLYYNVYIMDWGEDIGEDLCWFINDLDSFANDFYPTMLGGYRHAFFEIWRRNWSMRSWSDCRILSYIKNLSEKSAQIYAGQLFGLLLPEERNLFLEGRFENYNDDGYNTTG